MAQPLLEFYAEGWMAVAAGTVTLRLLARPPLLANAGVVLDWRQQTNPPGPWARMSGSAVIDNHPETVQGPAVTIPLKAGLEYVVRFQGQAVLAMPGFDDVEVAFTLSDSNGNLVTDFFGPQRAQKAHGAVMQGNVFLRCG
jgi:hypothetical protein